MDSMEAFDFHLPQAQIALNPASPRESGRLLHVTPDQNPAHQLYHVGDLPALLRKDDLLVFNNTKVIPAKLQAWRVHEGHIAHVGLTLDRPLQKGTWRVLVKNAKRLKQGNILSFFPKEDVAHGQPAMPSAPPDAVQGIIEKIEKGVAQILFQKKGEPLEGDDFFAFLSRCGQLALPPYIARPQGPTAEDAQNYQTVFSKYEGAVAAPTAGLHFTEDLLESLKKAGISWVFVTLHVGAGTFLPIQDSPETHIMHPEWGEISEQSAAEITKARREGRRIVPVGTTSLRLLESAADAEGNLPPWRGETSIFLRPGYSFRAADALLTNFHLPRSTLFMLVCAFSGVPEMRCAYEYAIKHQLRFYSYGDLCLLEKKKSSL